MEIGLLTEQHWHQVAAIYAEGIATGDATFESEPPDWRQFAASRPAQHRHVALEHEQVLGWAAAAPVSDRCVYAGVVEHSVYVALTARGRGVGRQLLQALVDSTEAAGIWTIQSGVFPENTASLRLHSAVGFRVVGTRARLGRMSFGPRSGCWRDVVLIERRSPVVGSG